jgi:hypothetical protein
VFLSPLAIAEALADDESLVADARPEIDAILGTAGAPPHIVARSLRSLLVNALRAPVDDFRGPIARVPFAIRRLIQELVMRDGRAATIALRLNEARKYAAA